MPASHPKARYRENPPRAIQENDLPVWDLSPKRLINAEIIPQRGCRGYRDFAKVPGSARNVLVQRKEAGRGNLRRGEGMILFNCQMATNTINRR
jgi:hypothetical protein